MWINIGLIADIKKIHTVARFNYSFQSNDPNDITGAPHGWVIHSNDHKENNIMSPTQQPPQARSFKEQPQPTKITNFRGTYAFLSNFYKSPFEVDIGFGKLTYPTAKHAYQAAKSNTQREHDKIRAAPTPGRAKAMGRKILLGPAWVEEFPRLTMMKILRAKFTSSLYLTQSLLETGDATLIESNTWHDNRWGNCICYKCRRTKGDNLLGELLMLVRSELRPKN